MKLTEIISNFPAKLISGSLDLEINGISQDSRSVEKGNLFLCVKGVKYDGHLFLEQAAQQGAVAAIVEDIPENNCGLTIIQTDRVGSRIREIAGAFYHYPEKKLKLIGVTGTNGKTTSTYLVKSILEAAGHQVGLIGTITNLIKDRSIPANNTTPGMLELQKLFAEMVREEVDYVVMEVSSHSIDQGRVAGLEFVGGIFTNITQDHLDYHKTFAEYIRVKTEFFKSLSVNAQAAINIDDANSQSIIDQTKANVITYGIKNQALVRATDIKLASSGVSFTAVTPQGMIPLDLKFTGYFNVYNSLGAIAVCLGLGIRPAHIKQGLEKITGVPGRFQLVPGSKSFGVIVDYAHTPDGLENILKTARDLTSRRLLLTFGCGGDRDRGKRPIMGGIAAKMADYTIITSDNPRSERPEQIIREIEAGFKEANPNAEYQIEVDRETAIKKLVAMAEEADLVLIAGKGHEPYQIFADRTIHFDDREVAKAAIEEKFNGKLHP